MQRRQKHSPPSGNERFQTVTNSLLEAFPHELARGRLKNTWRSSAICMFRNWLLYIADKKASLRTRMLSMGAKDRIPDLHPVAATPPA